ncbi:hypothetical protein GTW73_13880 [Streptomyces sp. SID4982]|nr:hypothetical protein [Streptomyces sp. SID4982]MYS15036.1 hypothetical protein [Streptomyces sp. SID4982]
MIELERAAEQERGRLAGLSGDEYEAQQRAWRAAAARFQAAVTEHAATAGVDRHDLEMTVKKNVRHDG